MSEIIMRYKGWKIYKEPRGKYYVCERSDGKLLPLAYDGSVKDLLADHWLKFRLEQLHD